MGSNDSIIRMNEIIKSIRRDDDVIRMSDEYLYEDIMRNGKGDSMEHKTIHIGIRDLYDEIKRAAETEDGIIIFSNGNNILTLEIKKPADKSTSNQKNIVTNWMDDILGIIDEAGNTITDKDALSRIESYCIAVKTCVTS